MVHKCEKSQYDVSGTSSKNNGLKLHSLTHSAFLRKNEECFSGTNKVFKL